MRFSGVRAGILFHEHPPGASSWEETMMTRLVSREGVQRVAGSMSTLIEINRWEAQHQPEREQDFSPMQFALPNGCADSVQTSPGIKSIDALHCRMEGQKQHTCTQINCADKCVRGFREKYYEAESVNICWQACNRTRPNHQRH